MLDRSRSRDRSKTGGAFSPAGLFVTGAQGAWYDPSDYSTLFQNAAGTTPVTAVEQPVRLMLDRSGRGNNATAPNDASRPVLRARYNQLTYSQEFDNAAWTATNTTFTTGQTAPDGTATAYILNGSNSFPRIHQTNTITAGVYTFSVAVKKGGSGTVALAFSDAGGLDECSFDIATGAVAVAGANISSSGVISEGDWWRLFAVSTRTAGPEQQRIFAGYPTNAGATFWGAQLLTSADQTATGGVYQRIAAATDYDTSNPVFRPYLAFDGSDDAMTIASSIHDVFQDVGGGTIWAGYNATAINLALIFVSNTNIANARAYLVSNRALGRREDADSGANAIDAGFVANTLYVGTNVADWAGGNNIRRTNGVQAASAAYSSGAGNTSNTASATAQIGAVGAAAFLDGRLYSAIILGRAATTAELTATESWIAGKTGVTL